MVPDRTPPQRDQPAETPKTPPVKAETKPEKKLPVATPQTPPLEIKEGKKAEEASQETPLQEENPVKTDPPKPEKPEIKEGMIIAEVDTQPVPISTSMPKIPRKIMRSIKKSETIIVSYLVDHRGNVERIKFIKKSQSADLNMLIIGAVKNWKFQPAVKEGKKVRIWMTKPIIIKK